MAQSPYTVSCMGCAAWLRQGNGDDYEIEGIYRLGHRAHLDAVYSYLH
jgi:hypothetical protein